MAAPSPGSAVAPSPPVSSFFFSPPSLSSSPSNPYTRQFSHLLSSSSLSLAEAADRFQAQLAASHGQFSLDRPGLEAAEFLAPCQHLAVHYELFGDFIDFHMPSKAPSRGPQLSGGFYFSVAAEYQKIALKCRILSQEARKLPPLDDSAMRSAHEALVNCLNKAYHSFKRANLTRLVLHSAFLLALEYQRVENFSMAQRFFHRLAGPFREENWPALLTKTLEGAMKSSKALGLTGEWTSGALELMAETSTLSEAEKRKICEEFFAVLSAPQDFPEAFDIFPQWALWRTLVAFRTLPRSVHVNDFIELRFSLILSLPLDGPEVFRVDRIFLKFNYEAFDLQLVANGENSPDSDDFPPLDVPADRCVFVPWLFHSNGTKNFRVRLKAQAPTGNSNSGLQLIKCDILYKNGFRVRMPGIPSKNEAPLRAPVDSPGMFEISLISQPETAVHVLAPRILPPKALCKFLVSHPQPLLLEEFYPIRLELENLGDFIRGGRIELTVKNATIAQEAPPLSGPPDSSAIAFFTQSGTSEALQPLPGDFLLPALLSPGENFHTIFFVQLTSLMHFTLEFRLFYQNEEFFEVSASHSINLQARTPWKVRAQFISDIQETGKQGNQTAEARLLSDRLCLLHVELENLSGSMLGIRDVKISFDPAIVKILETTKTQKQEKIKQNRHALPEGTESSSASSIPSIVLAAGERFTRLFYFVPNSKFPAHPPLALEMNWVRVKNCNAKILQKATSATPVKARASLSDLAAETFIQRELANVEAAGRSKGSAVEDSAGTIAVSRKFFSVPTSAANLHADVQEPRNLVDNGSAEFLQVAREFFTASFKAPVGRFLVAAFPIRCDVRAPPIAVLGESFKFSLVLFNLTDRLQELAVALEANEKNSLGRLVVEGIRNQSYRLLPSETLVLTWLCTGFEVGFHAPPRLVVKNLLAQAIFFDSGESGAIAVKEREK